MDVAFSRIAKASTTDKKITSDTIAFLFAPSLAADEPLNPCNHAILGCTWIGTSDERIKHQCPFDLVTCPASTKYGCKEVHERRKIQDHYDHFCRFHQMRCAVCGRSGIPKMNYCRHLERDCPTFHKHMKMTTSNSSIKRKGKNSKVPPTDSSKWKFQWISLKHIDRAFSVSSCFSKQLINRQAEVRLSYADEVRSATLDRIDGIRTKELSDLYEEKPSIVASTEEGEGTAKENENQPDQPAGDGNPYNWNIDRLLDFVGENKLQRVNKRKEQAEIVKDFIEKHVHKVHLLDTGKADKLYNEVVQEWKERTKKSKWGIENRHAQAKKTYLKDNGT